MEMFGDKFGLNITRVDAESRFLAELAGVSDPEAKRKIIGKVFVDVFDDESKKLTNVKWLAQGTILSLIHILKSKKERRTGFS